jgi:TetR/AcrR family transcriptional regulator, transcriptional repressor for nem operon
MIALPSDVTRAGPQVREAYQRLLEAMVWLYQEALPDEVGDRRMRAHALAATSVGGMVIARTLPDSDLAEQVREAALAAALGMLGPSSE